MASTIIAPEVEPQVEEQTEPVEEPKLTGWKQRVLDLLVAVFKGHEEFLGWTSLPETAK
jgi:hypothetical protein